MDDLTLKKAKRDHVVRVWKMHEENISASARALNVGRATLSRWLKKWGERVGSCIIK